MSLRRAARVFACLAFASFAASVPVGAEEALTVDHAPEPLVIKCYQVADLIMPLATSDAKADHADFDWLLDLIELRTGADCWGHGGGLGAINPHESTSSLLIRQTHAMHERIADLLDEIRGTGDLALSVEIQLIHGNLEACGEAKPHRTAQGLVDATGKERLLKSLMGQENGEILLAPKITFFNGTTASIETTTDGCTKSFNIRGVISKDNRYSRLWVDAKVDGQTTKAEVLIPEGHTAVRKLPGENSWLLVTSHVINAEEPQVIAPLKSSAPASPEQKRYLVPVDDSPEPTELTGIPQFKAQAEDFGLAVQRRKGAVEAAEKAAASDDAQPELATSVARVEYQVAQAEPRVLTVTAAAPPPPPVAVHGFVVDTVPNPAPAEGPYHLWLGDMPSKDVAHGFSINQESVDPPARLNVCLDDANCDSWTNQLQTGHAFGEIYVSPLTTSGVFFGPPITGGDINPKGWNGRPSVTITQIGPGRRAIYTTESHRAPADPPRPLEFVQSPQLPVIHQASGVEESITTLDDHLKAAQSALQKLGLDSEAKKLSAIRGTIRLRAEERLKVIDHEINRLKLARERLEKLAKPEATYGSGPVLEIR